jgi:DNA modification methylase
MIIIGDCLDQLALLDADSIDSCVTDPPYGLSFMGKKWDHDVPGVDVWREVYRVLKPGAFLLAFFGTRTYHRGVVNIEDAGFEIRDQVQWLYGSGFPKSHDVSKAVDKHLGAEREVVSTGTPVKRMIPGADQNKTGSWIKDNGREYVPTETAAGSVEAAQWEGWGTALKPANEPIVLARKPLIGTVAANVLAHGVGGLNVDGCRVGSASTKRTKTGGTNDFPHEDDSWVPRTVVVGSDSGRWPANVIHDGSDEVLSGFPDAPGQMADTKGGGGSKVQNVYGAMRREGEPSAESENNGAVGFKMKPGTRRKDTGSAARFFYCAKASKADRNAGLDSFEEQPSAASEFRPNHTEKAAEGHDGNPYGRWKPTKNNHPTVKPTALMRYLCRLVTPPGGTVLDPFAGSGSTGRGAVLEGFKFIGIEMDKQYAAIAEARIADAEREHLEAEYA